MRTRKRVADFSDPGTGKTYVAINSFSRQHKKDKKSAIVLCPKSLMRAAWANDIKKFAPHLRVSLAYATNRQDAMKVDADIYIVNVDGIKELAKLPKTYWRKFGRLIIDESDAYKHHTSLRSKAVAKLAHNFEYRHIMSGTPTGNGICDLWHQIFILDAGERLGNNFKKFQQACCTAEQNGKGKNMIKWTDRPNIEATVGLLIRDIVIRHKFEDCVDIPKNHVYAIETELSPAHMEKYVELEKRSVLILDDESITAQNKAILMGKLLQCVSGAIYNDMFEKGPKTYSLVDTERYELAMDLVNARDHSIVFYLWKHQLDQMVALAKKRKYSYVVWDADKPEIEQDFQAGKYKVLFGHPQNVAHGLTLTRARASIWPSPTYNLIYFRQGLKRVHRIGQTEKTETIVIVAKDTRDEHAWAVLQNKGENMDAFLREFENENLRLDWPCT